MNGNGRHVTAELKSTDGYWLGALSMALALVDRHPPVAKDTLKEFLRSDKPSAELAEMLRKEMKR